MAAYLDTSALVKLVVAEPESTALQRWLGEEDRRPFSCDLVRTEILRAVRRGDPERAERARAVLDSIALLSLSTRLCEEAARLEPVTLRSLDAIHLAAALSVGDDLDCMVVYDSQLSEAARGYGIAVVAPGSEQRAPTR